MPVRDVVLIGASAGGFGALRRLLGGLPAGLPASVLIAVHTAQNSKIRLPDALARFGPLPAAYAVPGQRLTPGLLTVAPAGQHLIVTAGDTLRLHRGPRVHHARPAVDVLLRSAAHACGDRTVAVVLSGCLRDGAEGAAAVAAAGGVVLVQDPADAREPGMPTATLDRVPDATAWPAVKLGPAIADLLDLAIPPGPAGAHRPVDGIDEALWTAVSRLHAHAAAQQRLRQCFDATSPLAARFQARAAHTTHAAQLITDHVLPIFQPEAHRRKPSPAPSAGPPPDDDRGRSDRDP
ncbi:chemotaxis protein CheB [Saccharothrix syringae]|uniref:chemotaxis protein CheB n=1 Tax=Saccharothrix syringae TaxID=103733 RepID=UPI00068BBC00|nr:chemotaxis protein CheB [Saccharothrix syringae]